ncbi:MAG: GDP-mannose 4,6-dehydratase, partial [Candidatus Saccharimonadales bacterium]
MAKRALITGITGQDGGHLAALLSGKNYEVYGLIRGQQNPKREMVERESPYVKLVEADLTDQSSLVRAVITAEPDEVYNLAAIS